MLPHRPAIRRFDRTRFPGQVAVEEFAEGALADEADPGGVFLVVVGQPCLRGDSPDFLLFEMADRKQHLRELRLVQTVQEIALVLGRVRAAQQLEPADALFAIDDGLAQLRIVPRGDARSADVEGVIEECLELDLGIAQHIRVGRAPGGVLPKKVCKDAVLVLGREIHRLQLDADHVGGRGGVDQVLPRRAVLVVIVVFPVLHEKADHVVALALKQQRRNRGIDPPGHADHNAFAHDQEKSPGKTPSG